jgi:Xaa-Pro aminopeptidase
MIKRTEFTNLPRLQNLVAESGFDAVLATSLVNVTYCAGFYDPGRRIMPNRTHAVVWPAVGEPTLIVPFYRVETETFIQDVRGYDFYIRDEELWDPRGRARVHRAPIGLLADVLLEKGLASGRIGLEMASFPAGHYEALRAVLPAVEFADCESLFDEARMVKTAAEIDLLQSAGIVTERAIRAGFELAESGSSSRDMANSIGRFLAEFGADAVAFVELDVMSGGKRFSYLEQPVPIQQGDLLRVDVGGLFDGYYSDVARMAVVGEPGPSQRATYRKLYQVQRHIITDILRPGVPGKELFGATSKTFEKAGFKTPWGVIVHGLGLYIHERPWIRECETYELEAGLVLCVEAISHGPDEEMWHVEDLILVTDDGAQELTTYGSSDELFVII